MAPRLKMVGDGTSHADVMCFDKAFINDSQCRLSFVSRTRILEKKSDFIYCHNTCLDLFQTNVALCSNCVFEVKSEVLTLKHNQSPHVSLYVKIVALLDNLSTYFCLLLRIRCSQLVYWTSLSILWEDNKTPTTFYLSAILL